MDAARVTTIAAGLHVGLVAAAAYYTTRINNDVGLTDISAKELAGMGGMALLPVLSAWIGLRLRAYRRGALAHGDRTGHGAGAVRGDVRCRIA